MNSINIGFRGLGIVEVVKRAGDDGGKKAPGLLRTDEAAAAVAVAIEHWHGMIEHMENAQGQASGLLARGRNAGLVRRRLRFANGLPGGGQ